jgi:hypothetical protein
VVQQDAKKDRHDQREKQEVALYQMAHRCPVMDARARFHGPIGLVEIPNLIFSKLSHFPQAASSPLQSSLTPFKNAFEVPVYPPKVVRLRQSRISSERHHDNRRSEGLRTGQGWSP